MTDHLSKGFAEPHKEIVVDEAMIKFTGRSAVHAHETYQTCGCLQTAFKYTLEGRAVQKKKLGQRVVNNLLKDKNHYVITFSRVSSYFRISTTASWLVVRFEKAARGCLKQG